MRVLRAIKWSLLVLVLVLVLSAGLLYWMASRVPSGYRPAQLTHEQRLHVAHTVLPSDVSAFHNIVQAGQLDTFSVGEERINQYLASLDEIATELNHARPGTIQKKFQDMGVAEPAVDLQPGSMVFMIRSAEYEKILSIQIGLEVKDEKVIAEVESVRVGSMPVPRSMVRGQLEKLGKALGRLEQDTRRGRDDADVWNAPSTLLPSLLKSALEREPLPATFDVRVARSRRDTSSLRRVRIEKIAITDDEVQLWLDPTRIGSRY
jgi:hypothetical protein